MLYVYPRGGITGPSGLQTITRQGPPVNSTLPCQLTNTNYKLVQQITSNVEMESVQGKLIALVNNGITSHTIMSIGLVLSVNSNSYNMEILTPEGMLQTLAFRFLYYSASDRISLWVIQADA